MISSLEDAGKVVTEAITALAALRPDLCDASGKAFWPVPARFPEFLAQTLHALQTYITHAYLHGNPLAMGFAAVRIKLMEILKTGDLGEDHTQLFLMDHPAIASFTDVEVARLPYAKFCSALLTVEDPLILLGLLTRDEEAGVAEACALAKYNLIKPDGIFARTHEIVEQAHGMISSEIQQWTLSQAALRAGFLQGQELHDRLYRTILESPS